MERKTHTMSIDSRQTGSAQKNTSYESLTPIDNIQNGDEYIAALDWALDQDDISNIAISGPYGSGKSSMINTYFKSKDRGKVLTISLAAFNLDSSKLEAGESIDNEDLESGILKQLFYSVSADKIPRSRFRKLQPENKKRNGILGLLLEFLLITLLYYITPRQMEVFVSSMKDFSLGVCVLVLAGIAFALWVVCFGIIKWINTNGNVQEIKILDRATIKNERSNNESAFDKNIDEILYFFEETGYRYVILEDLDRFEDTNIFVALRELNSLLNQYEGINEKVTFIYAIKDDMFEKEGERTKFFDFIIPIVPYISSTNSGEILRQKLHFKDEDSKSLVYDISERFISLISPYIDDMRVLTCICNEFVIFKNTLKGNQQLDLIDEEMFALITFKNLFPKEFALLEISSSESVVKQAFKDKRRLIESQKELISDKIAEQEQIITAIEKEVFDSVRELKYVMLGCLVDYQGSVRAISFKGKNYFLEELLDNEFDFSELKKNSLHIEYWIPSTHTAININDIEEYLSKKNTNYYERIAHLTNGLEKSKEEARRNIETFEAKVNELRTYSMSRIIQEFGIDFFSGKVKENDLIIFLLRNGFIDENYEDYINYFHPKSISKDEMNFILGVRNHRSDMDYTYPLDNVARVFERLQDYEFKQKEVLNYDLADYLLEEKVSSSSTDYFVNQLSNHSTESMIFIKSYVERERNVEILIPLLCKNNHMLWEEITEDNGITLETRFKYLNYILVNAEIDDILAQNKAQENDVGILTDFFETHPNILEKLSSVKTSKLIQVIEGLDVCFRNTEVELIDESLKQYIFDNNRYELNDYMICRVVQWRNPDAVQYLSKRNYTTILELGYRPLLEYVQSNIASYVNQFVIGVESNTEETIVAVEDIVDLLLPEHMDVCLAVLDKELVIWDRIEECCDNLEDDNTESKKEIWKYLLINQRINCTWENVASYYNHYGCDYEWIDYVEKNIDDLVREEEKPAFDDETIEALFYADIKNDAFRTLIKGTGLESYDNSLEKLSSEKIEVLIEEGMIQYDVHRWNELQRYPLDLRIIYAEKYETAFIDSIDSISLSVDEACKLLKSDVFNDYQKKSILMKIPAQSINTELAEIIKRITFDISRPYIDRSWSILPEEEKYELLLNHLNVYTNDELPSLFSQLADIYQPLVARTKHKFTLPYTDYNQRLLSKLLEREYLTSVDESRESSSMDEEQSTDNHVLTGYVKQSK